MCIYIAAVVHQNLNRGISRCLYRNNIFLVNKKYPYIVKAHCYVTILMVTRLKPDNMNTKRTRRGDKKEDKQVRMYNIT